MRIFISWSGNTSKQVAQALNNWLPDVLQHVCPFMSAADLQPGTRWGPELSRELEQIDFGIACMTPDNLQRPWIMFEAGALSKRVATARVVPYLFGIGPQNLEGPLTQFQSVAADKDGTYRLVDSIPASMATQPLTSERLAKAFDRWWPNLETKLAEISAQPATPPTPEPDEREMLKELLLTVRNIQRNEAKTKISSGDRRTLHIGNITGMVEIPSQFEIGQQVHIKSGALAGLEGNVVEMREGGRVFVRVAFLNQSAGVLVTEDQLERLE